MTPTTGALLGALTIVGILLPTLLFSFILSPKVLKNYALLTATALHQTEVPHELEALISP